MSIIEKLLWRHSVASFMLLCFYVNLRCCTTSFMDSLWTGALQQRAQQAERQGTGTSQGLSPWRHGFTAAWKSGGTAGATHVQISWISAWIPSEVTRKFFFDLPIWDSNSSSFSCRSFSSQREPTVVGSNIIENHSVLSGYWNWLRIEFFCLCLSLWISSTQRPSYPFS